MRLKSVLEPVCQRKRTYNRCQQYTRRTRGASLQCPPIRRLCIWVLEFQLIRRQTLTIFTLDMMYFQLRFRVSSGQLLITTALVFSEVFFNGLMSQDLTGSFSVYGDIGLTYLKVEHIRVPLWIHRARHERLCSLLPFEVGLLHYFTVASDFSSAANTPG